MSVILKLTFRIVLPLSMHLMENNSFNPKTDLGENNLYQTTNPVLVALTLSTETGPTTKLIFIGNKKRAGKMPAFFYFSKKPTLPPIQSLSLLYFTPIMAPFDNRTRLFTMMGLQKNQGPKHQHPDLTFNWFAWRFDDGLA